MFSLVLGHCLFRSISKIHREIYSAVSQQRQTLAERRRGKNNLFHFLQCIFWFSLVVCSFSMLLYYNFSPFSLFLFIYLIFSYVGQKHVYIQHLHILDNGQKMLNHIGRGKLFSLQFYANNYKFGKLSAIDWVYRS